MAKAKTPATFKAEAKNAGPLDRATAKKTAAKATAADETPEAQPTKVKAERAATKQFRKADRAAAPDTADNEKPEETALRMAVRGF